MYGEIIVNGEQLNELRLRHILGSNVIKTKYTTGFEKFWRIWKLTTGKTSDKPEAFGYWKRDRLEGDEDELIRILGLQAKERKKNKGWKPDWCYCRKWLNKRRYEYVPEQQKNTDQERLEKKRQEIRASYGQYYREQTKEALQGFLTDKMHITHIWLIEEILNG